MNVRARLTVFLLLGVAAVAGLIFARQLMLSRNLPYAEFAEKKVRLLTYSTFAGTHGPLGDLIKTFEAGCRCKVDVATVSDAGLLLERLKVGRFDIVVGLDQLMLEQARREFAWNGLEVKGVEWQKAVADTGDSEFVPFDWSPLGFVYRKDAGPVPEKFDDLRAGQYRKQFALQDPHASTPGAQFLNWVLALKGDGAQRFLQDFQANIHSINPSWAFAYGLFKRGQARFVFSYLTSLAFHWGVENDRSIQILSFPEGHPVQIEFLAVPSSCVECELGAEFAQHLMQPESQKVIMEKNFMLPALTGVEQGTVFGELPRMTTLKTKGSRDFGVWDELFAK